MKIFVCNNFITKESQINHKTEIDNTLTMGGMYLQVPMSKQKVFSRTNVIYL